MIDPERLAVAFVEAVLPETESREKAEQLRATLLDVTLKHAYTFSEYYSSILPDSVLEEAFLPGDLAAIPLLSKVQLRHHLPAVRTSKGRGILQYTTGTTASPLSVYRTDQEVAFLQEFFRALQRILYGTNHGPKPLVLNLANVYHGNVIDLPIRGYRISTGLFDPVLLKQIMHWLTTPHDIPGVEDAVSMITGIYESLQWLTAMLMGKNFDFSKCAVKRIYPMGGYVSTRWESLLRRVWSAEIIPVYGLMEIMTHSNRCPACKAYHFLPNVIPELVGPVTRTPIREGAGELVLTGLYPFIQGQPAIRYTTGDLFLRPGHHCPYGDSYLFLGRVRESLVVEMADSDPVVIGSAVIQDILDEEPDVNRLPFFGDLPGIFEDGSVGKPKFTMSKHANPDQTTGVKVAIELRYQPGLFPDHTAGLKEKVLNKILQNIAPLKIAREQGRVDLDLIFEAPHSARRPPS